ncbi:MAG: hypothetical protein NXI28_13430 [bacterium]|nr:hypothetical protein [bacterium]
MNKPRQQTFTQGGDANQADATEELMNSITWLIARRSLREPPFELFNENATDIAENDC